MHELTDLLARHGLLIVFANVLLTQAGLPVPAVPMLVVAGALVVQGAFGYAALLLVGMAATLLGHLPWYFAGRRYGHRVLGTLCRIAVEPDSCVRQTENLFERWGASSLVISKFIPGFSMVAPPLAGAMRLGLWSFLLFSAIGALLWAAAPVLLGAVFHAEVERALEWFAQLGTGALLLLGVLATAYVAIKAVQRYFFLRMLRAARVSVAELYELLNGELPPVVIDVRPAAVRRLDPRRIPGALAVNLEDAAAALPGLPPDRDVVVYCS
ncbi:MAG: VTT domain-containing protein [Burkholderiales bacterium]|nr:VTT domain-containing protein [Burkholderiales bacterium]